MEWKQKLYMANIQCQLYNCFSSYQKIYCITTYYIGSQDEYNRNLITQLQCQLTIGLYISCITTYYIGKQDEYNRNLYICITQLQCQLTVGLYIILHAWLSQVAGRVRSWGCIPPDFKSNPQDFNFYYRNSCLSVGPT